MESFLNYGETIVFIVMGISSILAVAVTLDRLNYFFRNEKNSAKIISESIVFLKTGKNQADIELSDANKQSVYVRFTSFVREHFDMGADALSPLLESKIIEERIGFEKRMTVLASLGNNAPFIGLLGTVLGIIKAFFNLGTLGNTGAEIVMKSISTALLATACGLVIAIPVVITNNIFSKKTRVIMQNLEILSRAALSGSIISKNNSKEA